MTVYVRAEVPEDHAAVDEVVRQAFAPESGGTAEVGLVAALRRDPEAWLPRLSLVAVADGEVVGYALGARIHVGAASAVALAPLAVRPDHQGQGVGQALVRRLVGEARSAGETLVLVLGGPDYYAQFGFRPAADLGIVGPYQGRTFQALPLAADAPVGRAVYPVAFSDL